jgi:hypothetical protein
VGAESAEVFLVSTLVGSQLRYGQAEHVGKCIRGEPDVTTSRAVGGLRQAVVTRQ